MGKSSQYKPDAKFPDVAAIVATAETAKVARIKLWEFINSRQRPLEESQALAWETYIAVAQKFRDHD